MVAHQTLLRGDAWVPIALYSADPETQQLDRGTANAGCRHGATGKTRVRSLELAGMGVMVAVQGSGIGR